MGIVSTLWKQSNQSAYEWALWKGKETKRIRVEVVDSKARQRAVAGANIIADEGRITLKTRYVLQYSIDDVITFRNKDYIITGFASDNYEVLPQNTAVVKGDYLQEITMFLYEIGQDTRNLQTETPVITVSQNTATITCPTLNATIYYTTDGSRPNSLSTKYTAPFTIDGSVSKIYAIAICKGFASSLIAVWEL